MSLAEATALLQTLGDLDKMLSQIETKVQTLHVETGHATGKLREMEYILFRTVSILGRLGLPERLDGALMQIQKMITAVRILHSTMMFLEMGTPYGWALAGVSLVAAGVMGHDLIAYDNEGR